MNRTFRLALSCFALSLFLSHRGVVLATCPGDEACCIGNGTFSRGCEDSVCFATGVDLMNMPETCESGNQCHVNSSCTPDISRVSYTVSADEDLGGTLQADTRQWEASSAQAHRGTIVFAPGLNGTTFLSDDSGIAKTLNELAAVGFTVIDTRWTASWKGTDFGNRVEASYYATLLKYFHYQLVACGAGGPMIVVGHSSGAGEVAYGLTTYGMEPYIDLAILSSGPPETRLDLECTHESDPCNATWCDDLFCSYEPNTFDGQQWSGTPMCPKSEYCMAKRPPCAFDTDDDMQNTPSCGSYETGDEETTNCDPVGEANYQRKNSILWSTDSTALHDFPRTTIHTILGTMDAGQGPVGGLYFYDHVDSRKRLWFFQNGNHNWFDAGGSAGRKTLKYAIEFFTRPWTGDTDYDGDVDTTDYRETCKRVSGCCTVGAGPVQCVTPPTGCPPAPDPDDIDANYDVDNNGVVDADDVALIAGLASCTLSPSASCADPESLKKCDEPPADSINKALYPTPSAQHGEDPIDCSGEAPLACGFACAWCSE